MLNTLPFVWPQMYHCNPIFSVSYSFLQLVTEDEKTRFKLGEGRYNNMKKQRLFDQQHSIEVAQLEELYNESEHCICECSNGAKNTPGNNGSTQGNGGRAAKCDHSKGTGESKSGAGKDTTGKSESTVTHTKDTAELKGTDRKVTPAKDTGKVKDSSPKHTPPKGSPPKSSTLKHSGQTKDKNGAK